MLAPTEIFKDWSFEHILKPCLLLGGGEHGESGSHKESAGGYALQEDGKPGSCSRNRFIYW